VRLQQGICKRTRVKSPFSPDEVEGWSIRQFITLGADWMADRTFMCGNVSAAINIRTQRRAADKIATTITERNSVICLTLFC
jgi:hypothetical protein